MRVTAWRIFKRKYAASAFSGEGARLNGGRWNNKGTAIVYMAGSCSLAVLELLVQLESRKELAAYQYAEASFDDQFVQPVALGVLPADWRAFPAPNALKDIGDKWIADGRSAVLQVPSAVIEIEFNYLLNPAHPDFTKITFGEARRFSFDPRLIK